MGYKLLYDKQILFDVYSGDYVTDAQLSMSVNSTSYFDFTISLTHSLYNIIAEHAGIVELYFDDAKLFSGEITKIDVNLNGNKDITCAGALDYLSYTLVRPYSTIDGEADLLAPSSVDGYFNWLIEQHNKHCLDSRKHFFVGVNQGNLLDNNNYIYRASSTLPTTSSEIEDKILNSVGGYLYVRYKDDKNILDLYADTHEANTQIIDFGVNITDFVKTTSTDDQYTAVIATGYTPDPPEDDPQKKMNPINLEGCVDGGTPYSPSIVKMGDVVYDVNAVARYGYKEYHVSNDDIKTYDGLLQYACKVLNKLLSPALSVSVKAVDLSLYMKDKYEHMQVGQAVRVRSKLHNIDEYLVVNSITLDMNNPENTEYQLGESYDTLTGQQSSYLRSLNSSIVSNLDSVAKLDSETKKNAKDIAETKDVASNAAKNANEAKDTANSTKTELTSAINGISVGGRNLARKTSNDWSEWITPRANATNVVNSSGSTIYFPSEINVGDEYYIQCEIEFDNVTSSDGKRSHISLQGSVDGKWETNKFNPWQHYIYDIENGIIKISKKVTSKVKPIPPEVYADCSFRVDDWATGRYRWRRIKVELGNKPTDWSPAPEDIINEAKNEAIDGINIGGRNLFYLTKETPIAKSNEGNTGRNYNSYHSDFGSGGSLTKTVDGLKLVFGSNTNVSIQVPLAEFGNVANDDIVTLSFTYRGNITTFGWFYFLQKTTPNVALTISSPLNDDESWHKYSYTFSHSQANIRTCVSCLLFYNNIKYDNSKWIEIKAGTLKLEKGNKATDWSPAPEDLIAESKTYTDVQVNQTAKDLTTTITKVQTTANEAKGTAESAKTSTNKLETLIRQSGDGVEVAKKVNDEYTSTKTLMGPDGFYIKDLTDTALTQIKSDSIILGKETESHMHINPENVRLLNGDEKILAAFYENGVTLSSEALTIRSPLKDDPIQVTDLKTIGGFYIHSVLDDSIQSIVPKNSNNTCSIAAFSNVYVKSSEGETVTTTTEAGSSTVINARANAKGTDSTADSTATIELDAFSSLYNSDSTVNTGSSISIEASIIHLRAKNSLNIKGHELEDFVKELGTSTTTDSQWSTRTWEWRWIKTYSGKCFAWGECGFGIGCTTAWGSGYYDHVCPVYPFKLSKWNVQASVSFIGGGIGHTGIYDDSATQCPIYIWSAVYQNTGTMWVKVFVEGVLA
mgnify:CR=1 FL=1